MKTTTLFTTAGLLGMSLFAGSGSAQPPTAPPLREKTPVIDGPPVIQVFWIDGKVRVHVRWEGKESYFRGVGTQVVVRDGVLSLTGMVTPPVVLSLRRPAGEVGIRYRLVTCPNTRLDLNLGDGTQTYTDP